MNKRTKIICTLGPATPKEIIKEFICKGMSCARLNFSHGEYEVHKQRIDTVKELNTEMKTNVAILLDTKGPEIRTHQFANGKAEIIKDSIVQVHMNKLIGDANKFSITYKNLIHDIKKGNHILVDDGYLCLEVISKNKKENYIETKALNTAVLKDRRGINVPGIKLNLSFLSEIDKQDILFGVKEDVDFIAASFVRRAEDVIELRSYLKEINADNIKIIAKIECKEGVDNIDEIIKYVDGVMVARGDLGVEVPAAEVPLIQKSLIKKCNIAGKFVITATQMLESMITSSRPTRAEVSDIANAVIDGTDAIMLSGETAVGKYPVRSVEIMTEIAYTIEKDIDFEMMIDRGNVEHDSDITAAIGLAVADTALKLNASAIICPSISGYTARSISKLRASSPVIALNPSNRIARSLALNWGVYPYVINVSDNTDVLFEQSISVAKEILGIKPKDKVIITAGVPIGKSGSTNMLKVIEVK